MIRTGNLDLYGRTLKVAVHSLSADEMSNKSNVLCVVSSFAVMLFSAPATCVHRLYTEEK